MALPPPPVGTSINENSGFMSKGWVQWFQDVFISYSDGRSSLKSVTLASNETLIINSDITSAYGHYIIELQDVKVSSPGDTLYLRVSSDTGATYKSGASDYTWQLAVNNGSVTTTSDSLDSELHLTTATLDNGSDDILNGRIEFFSPTGSSNASHFKWELQYKNTSGALTTIKGAGLYNTPASFDAIKLYLGAGVFTSGSYKLYGIR